MKKIIIKQQQTSDADDPIDFAHNMVAADGFETAHEVATTRLAFWQQIVTVMISMRRHDAADMCPICHFEIIKNRCGC